jgi:hypothetical protein
LEGGTVKFWAGVGAALLSVAPVPEQVLVAETFVQTATVEVEVPVLFEPYVADVADVDAHSDCLWHLMRALGVEMEVGSLFVVADFADLMFGGACGMLDEVG